MNSTKIPSVSAEHKAMVDKVFAKFSVVYGHTWRTLFKTPEFLEYAKAEWIKAISPFNEEEITVAINKSLDKNKFPPSIPEFVDYCKSHKNRGNNRVKMSFTAPNPTVVKFELEKMKHMLGMFNNRSK